MAAVPKLEKFQDALKEMGNIGAGKASNYLSKLIGKPVNQTPPEIYLLPRNEVPDLIGGPQSLVVGIYTAVSGDVSGTMLLVFPTKDAMTLVDVLSKKKVGMTKTLNAVGQEKLKQAGKTLSFSYLRTIKDFLGLNFRSAPTRIISTFGESLTDFVLLGVEEDYALLLKTQFSIDGTNVKGDFILLLAIDSLSIVSEALRKKIE